MVHRLGGIAWYQYFGVQAWIKAYTGDGFHDFAGDFLIDGILKITPGLKLSPEEECNGAGLSDHKISAIPAREVSW